MFQAHRAHHQERQTVSIQPLVSVTPCRWPCRVQVGSSLPTCTWHGHQHRMTVTRCIDTICLSRWWALCARNMYTVKNKNKYRDRNLCVMLVIYQESLHDALSTKYKKNTWCKITNSKLEQWDFKNAPLDMWDTMPQDLTPNICTCVTMNVTYRQFKTMLSFAQHNVSEN